jgi:signal transduction histidine kinase
VWRHVDTGEATLVVESSGSVRAVEGRLQRLLENLFRNALEPCSTEAGEGGQDASDDSDGDDSDGDDSDGDDSDAGEGGGPATDEPPVGGPVVRVGVLDDGAGFYVADDGTGVPPERRDWIFDSGNSTGEAGTGLGLTVVSQVAASHGWSVAVTDAAGGGAEFRIGTDGEDVRTDGEDEDGV